MKSVRFSSPPPPPTSRRGFPFVVLLVFPFKGVSIRLVFVFPPYLDVALRLFSPRSLARFIDFLRTRTSMPYELTPHLPPIPFPALLSEGIRSPNASKSLPSKCQPPSQFGTPCYLGSGLMYFFSCGLGCLPDY